MKCPNCKGKITTKNYDPEYQWYDCPKCEGSFTADEIDEAASGTSPGKRSKNVSKKAGVKKSGSGNTAVVSSGGSSGNGKPMAKGKKRAKADADAIAAYEAEALKPVKSAEADSVHHRDEVPTAEILNIFADEIEAIAEETGVKVDRLNAREFYAMNIWRELAFKNGVKARDKKSKFVLCKEHE